MTIHDVGVPDGNRISRAIATTGRYWGRLRELGPAVVHFHDADLLLLGCMLALGRTRVIYDVHEDYPEQMAYKDWIPTWARRPVARAFAAAEWLGARLFSGIIAVTPRIAARFPPGRTWIVRNFPLQGEFPVPAAVAKEQPETPSFAYVGGLLAVRGIREMVSAIEILSESLDATLDIGGAFGSESLYDEMTKHPGWEHVRFEGYLSRPGVGALLGGARAGLVLLHPVTNLMHAYPVKLFEYMSAGLPVIASDFPGWRELLDGCSCAVFVDPLHPSAIADAMRWVIEHPAEACEMGQRGREAVEERFNWDLEAETLRSAYRNVLRETGAV